MGGADTCVEDVHMNACPIARWYIGSIQALTIIYPVQSPSVGTSCRVCTTKIGEGIILVIVNIFASRKENRHRGLNEVDFTTMLLDNISQLCFCGPNVCKSNSAFGVTFAITAAVSFLAYRIDIAVSALRLQNQQPL
jgi:hypothetical protein